MSSSIDYQQYLASREWRLKRKEVIERNEGICERCASRQIENVHHVTYERVGQELPSDLIGVCSPCHEYLSGERDNDPAIEAIVNIVTERLSPAIYKDGRCLFRLVLRVFFVTKDQHALHDPWLPRIEIEPGMMAIFRWTDIRSKDDPFLPRIEIKPGMMAIFRREG